MPPRQRRRPLTVWLIGGQTGTDFLLSAQNPHSRPSRNRAYLWWCGPRPCWSGCPARKDASDPHPRTSGNDTQSINPMIRTRRPSQVLSGGSWGLTSWTPPWPQSLARRSGGTRIGALSAPGSAQTSAENACTALAVERRPRREAFESARRRVRRGLHEFGKTSTTVPNRLRYHERRDAAHSAQVRFAGREIPAGNCPHRYMSSIEG